MKYFISELEKNDYDKHYLQLLKELTFIEPHKITRDIFNDFVKNLNNNNIIFVI